MFRKVRSVSLATGGLAALAAALAVGASGAGASFVEPGVRVLQQFDSNGPAPAGSYFGWAVSQLGDVDGDHVQEAIVGEPSSGADSATGDTTVYSGRTGDLLVNTYTDVAIQSETAIASNPAGTVMIAGHNDGSGFDGSPVSLSGLLSR